MAKIDHEFHKLCKTILDNGVEYENKRRGVKRLQIPTYNFRHYSKDGFPAITNKKLFWKGVVGELIWFLRGDNDIEYMNKNGITIWNQDAYNWHKKEGGTLSFEEFEAIGKGFVGQNYSVQWRNFSGQADQIKNLITDMKNDIMGSRLIVDAWNAAEIHQTPLPPCHKGFQVVGEPLSKEQRILIAHQTGKINEYNDINVFMNKDLDEWLDENIIKYGFHLCVEMRAWDVFLGAPFNIASYALLAEFLEAVTGHKYLSVEFYGKCVHLYDNQIEAAKELLQRNPDTHANCELETDPEFNILCDAFRNNVLTLDEMLNEFRIDMFKLKNYTADSEIKVDMLAPKELEK